MTKAALEEQEEGDLHVVIIRWLRKHIAETSWRVVIAISLALAAGTVLVPDPGRIGDAFEAQSLWDQRHEARLILLDEHLIYQDELLLSIMESQESVPPQQRLTLGDGAGPVLVSPAGGSQAQEEEAALAKKIEERETWVDRRDRLVEEFGLSALLEPVPPTIDDVSPPSPAGGSRSS